MSRTTRTGRTLALVACLSAGLTLPAAGATLVRNNDIQSLDPLTPPMDLLFDPGTGDLLGTEIPQAYEFSYHHEALVQTADGPLVLYELRDSDHTLLLSKGSGELFAQSYPGRCHVVGRGALDVLLYNIPRLHAEYRHAQSLFGIVEYAGAIVCEDDQSRITAVRTLPHELDSDRVLALTYMQDWPTAFITITWSDGFDYFSLYGGLRHDRTDPQNPVYVALDAGGNPAGSRGPAQTSTCEEVGITYHDCVVSHAAWLADTLPLGEIAVGGCALPECQASHRPGCGFFGAMGYLSLLSPLIPQECQDLLLALHDPADTSCPTFPGSDPDCLAEPPLYGTCRFDFLTLSPYCEYPTTGPGSCVSDRDCGGPPYCTDGQCWTDAEQEVCDGYDNDCDSAIDEDVVPEPDVCDGIDNDCDPGTPDGFADPLVGIPCDGPDSDLCEEGISYCAGGVIECTDGTGDDLDLCDGVDNDCDPTTPDGYHDPGVGQPCDGADTDLCQEGTLECTGGQLVCDDTTGDNLDVCDAIDNDCDPTTPDGYHDPGVGLPCDGADTDLCEEGTIECVGGALTCNDTTGNNIDTCDGVDNDCDPSTPDGSGSSQYMDPCDGSDGDYCDEGVWICPHGSWYCTDNSGTTVEECNGIDDDCDGLFNEGFPPYGGPCGSDPITYLGSIRGDEGYDQVHAVGYAQQWFHVNIREESSSNCDLRAWIELWVPWGIDFNLLVYCESCSGPVAGSSYVWDHDGHAEIVKVGKDDTIWPNEEFDIYIGVLFAWREIDFCDYWDLYVSGNITGAPITCD